MAGVKPIIDLTRGGDCPSCDTAVVCCNCGVGPTPQDPLSYAPAGDHDHLVMYHGSLGREAHGRFQCAKHYGDPT